MDLVLNRRFVLPNGGFVRKFKKYCSKICVYRKNVLTLQRFTGKVAKLVTKHTNKWMYHFS